MLLIAAGVTCVVLLLSRHLHYWLTRPILELSDMARRVARDKDCSVRAGKSSEDEPGVLVDAFNGMLETIEMQNRRQSQGQQRLEALAAERTAALEQAQARLLPIERNIHRYESIINELLDPLFSTRAFGIGLGLAIVRQILEQHAGGVELDSTPGQGTQVRLWMPWSKE